MPRLLIEAGSFSKLPELISQSGAGRIGIVHGRSVYKEHGEVFRESLRRAGISFSEIEVRGEPSPSVVDGITDFFRPNSVELIVAVGGGSVLDAGKAAAAMLAESGDARVKDYLEGVGSMTPSGRTIPVYAVPSTAGTGSEATKNSVISEIGSFKKSLRHDNYIPRLACIDPELAVSASIPVTAAAGLDALSQLMEAFHSTQANPFIDALCLSGLEAAGRGFSAVLNNPGNIEARAEMGYAAYCSGVGIANAGLGLVHGAAGLIGGIREIPHGVVCGLLLPGTLRRIILKAKADGKTETVRKLEDTAGALQSSLASLPDRIEGWLSEAGLKSFGSYGFTPDDMSDLAGKTSQRNSPVDFSREEILEVLMEKL